MPAVASTLGLVLCPRSEQMGSRDGHLPHCTSSWSLGESSKMIAQWIATGDCIKKGKKEKERKGEKKPNIEKREES